MNHCPVYTAIGGHAYGWVYPGPIGSVLTPALIGVRKAGHLPNASTFCGRCEEVCPMKIPLPGLMRHWREEEFSAGDTPLLYGLGLKAWAAVAKRPRLYHTLARIGIPLLATFGRRRGAFRRLPFAGGWTRHRDLAAPAEPHLPGAVGRSQGRGAQMSGGTDGRNAVIFKIRKALGTYDSAARRSAVAERLGTPPPPLVPERAKRDKEQLRGLFRQYLEGQSATVVEAASAAEVPAAIARFLRSTNLPLRVRVGDDAYLDKLAWGSEPALERRKGPAVGDDEVGLSHATAAVAETGTLVLASGADNPVTLNYLPETHIVVVEDKDLVGGYEGAWDKIRARFGKRAMPRTVNFVSGPSRTADIGGQLVMGAHGPRRLCVILVRGEGLPSARAATRRSTPRAPGGCARARRSSPSVRRRRGEATRDARRSRRRPRRVGCRCRCRLGCRP